MKKAVTAFAAIFLLTACSPATGPGNKEPDTDNNNIEQQNYRGNDVNDRNMRQNNMDDTNDNNLNRQQLNDDNLGPDMNDKGPYDNGNNNDMDSNNNMVK